MFRSGDPFLEYCYIHHKDFQQFDINVDKNIVVTNCFTTNCETLQRTIITESKTYFSEYPPNSPIKKLFPAVRILLRKLQIKTILKSEIDDMILYPYNKDTSPRLTFDKYL